MVKIGMVKHEIEARKIVDTINKTRSVFFEKIIKIEKSLARLTTKMREKT